MDNDAKKSYHLVGVEDTLRDVNSSDKGISQGEAEKRLLANGANTLPEGNHKSIAMIFAEQFKNVMIWVLIGAAIISIVLGEYADAVIILLVVMLNSVMGTVQEAKAEAALESLKSMTAPKAMVVRDSIAKNVDASEIVVGDMVLLEAGVSVPADIRIAESATLSVVESALTGESEAVIKSVDKLDDELAVVGDMVNMAFMGTSVSYGRGAGVVVKTGADTQMGNIAKSLAQTKDESTPLQKKINEISRILSVGVVIIAVVIFGIGLFTGREVFDMFLLAVSLAVAAIPEGLATVVTIVLAMGMKRMAKQGAIIRKLPAVETLGSTGVICSDKTGTLTMNRMTVQEMFCDFLYIDNIDKSSQTYKEIIDCMAQCNDSNLDEKGIPLGDPTETALMDYVLNNDLWEEKTLRTRQRYGEVPFDSVRKLMSVLIKDPSTKDADEKYKLYTKGAPDVLIQRCTHIMINGKIKPLNDELREDIIKANVTLANRALRILAFAMKLDVKRDLIVLGDEENDLVFLGLCGEMDPPRKEAAMAVERCKKAGIIPVMITGDHKITASAIAKKLGILTGDDQAIEGRAIETMDDVELDKIVETTRVYARVSPEHKVRIVDAWQRKGMIVAMTGDGVNDAPALKSADIGVGMGITGTDVSKAASDMVLTDDNFATIVEAVQEGRKIYTNIKKAVKFLLSSNMGEVIALFVATLLGWTLFRPVHILWINLVTDTFPALALGMEKGEDNVMEKPPRDAKEPFFSKKMWLEIAIHGLVEGAITLAVFAYARASLGVDVATTMAFITLGLTQLFHALGGRFDIKSFFSSPFSNKYMILAFFGSGFLQIAVVLITPIREAFSLVTLTPQQWLIAIVASFAMLIFSEVEKLIKRARA